VAAFAFVLVPHAIARPAGGFAAYYVAGRTLLDGESPEKLYDDVWFRARVEALVPGASEIYFVNPPTTALAARPLASLAPRPARAVFVVAGAVALLAAVALMLGASRPPAFLALAFAAYSLACQPVRVNLREAQVYTILLLLMVLAWIASRYERPVFAGICLGLVTVFKIVALPVWIVVLAQRRWRTVFAGIATVGLVVAATWPLFDAGTWRAFARYSREWSRHPAILVTAHQADASLLGRLFRFDARINPHPLVDAPLVATLLGGAIAIAALALLWRLARRDNDLAFGAATALSLILTPVSQSYAYVFALLPAGLLLLRPGLSPRSRLLLVVALALIGIWFLPFRMDSGPLLTLLSYPKLYAAWILFALCVREGANVPTTAPAAGSPTR
jgi:hypothetical protein